MLISPIFDHIPKTLKNPSPFSSPFIFPNSKTLTCKNPKKFFICVSASKDLLPQSAIQRIAEKLRSLGYVEESKRNRNVTLENPISDSTSPGEIFVPLPTQLPKYRVGHSFDQSWSTPENPVPMPGSGKAIRRYNELRREAWKEKVKKRAEERGEGRVNVPTLAELKLSPEELKRLRGIGIAIEKKLRIGKPGITEGIVNGIHERWRKSELVKLKCEDQSRLNMKRTHDLLERKTGGLVIWRSGSIIILYRGSNYKYPYFKDDADKTTETSPAQNRAAQPPIIRGVGLENRVRLQLPGESQLVEEADHLLEGLGPRYADWWGYEPLPVDADLLPAIVSGHRRPFRLLPFGVKPTLTNDEMTTLRRLGRPLPCHFVLGRNRKLQGLAVAIIKLWEKCEIAKIAVKRGVQNMNSVLMAEELKWLTGGTILSRDREYIVIYRGKDFLPSSVSSAIEQRRNQGFENRTRTSSTPNAREYKLTQMEMACENNQNDDKRKLEAQERKLRTSEAAFARTSAKLSMAVEKKEKAEKLLEELEKEETLESAEVDKEGISEEERYMLRKVGLRMKPFLLLGRRGVFDGTVENMHLHWKYRELVKIISGSERSFEEVLERAHLLESESGGILVAVERVSKGYAIIVYRGKNYERPDSLRPQTLLNKKQALKRSIEAQRRESLKLNVLKLSRNVDELKNKLEENKEKLSMNRGRDVVVEPVEDEEHDQYQLIKYQRSNTDLHTSSVSSTNGLHPSQQDFSTICADDDKDEFGLLIESESESDSVLQESINTESSSEPHADDIKLSVDAVKSEAETSASKNIENVPFRAAPLSNKERLLLRKQALKMKHRPVLAVGKSNIISGVARTIKDHFRKHPLAIVNIKGRANGTSVPELVNRLEKATGGVLVSQEPSKVILYRGWGSIVDPNGSRPDPENLTRPGVSPELLSAIRIECGLQRKLDG